MAKRKQQTTDTTDAQNQAVAALFQNNIIGYATKPASQFKKNPLNYRTHPKAQREAVNGSLKSLGWIAPVIENVTTGNLLDGHERVEQALPTDEDVPFLQVRLTEEQEKLALAIFDPITALAESDGEVLVKLLSQVTTEDAALQKLIEDLEQEAQMHIKPPSLDELRETYGEPNARDFWPVIHIQVDPDTMAQWDMLLGLLPGEDDALKAGHILRAVDQKKLMSGSAES